MPKQIVIAEQHRVAAVFSEDQIQELIVATGSHQVSDIYLGSVENVLPGIDAAFVNIGDSERNGFIHVSDLGPLRLRRSAGSITELLEPQQKVLVQVMKEPTGNKGPRLTGNVSLPGRYLVMMPYGRGVNLSRRIRSENERNRLRSLAILIKPMRMGLVVRTEAEGMPEEAIIEDLESLQKQWETILLEAKTTRAPALLNRDDDFIQRVLRDVYSADVNRIVVDSHTGLKRVKQQLMNWSGGKAVQGVLIDHHRDRIPLLEYFRVNAAIREALKPRVDLPSGGYIIIEPTEALTVIDVNSGSFTRSATARETVLWTNCEAATEIARQLRLRNVAGVIVVDFIDMDSHRDQLQVLEHFNKALKADKARPQIAQLSELGLVELTRKRQGKNVYELFGRPCQTCGGLGHLVHLPGEHAESDGEIIERPVAKEYRTSEPRPDRHRLPDISLPADFSAPGELPWEGQAEESDLDATGEFQDLDLMQHSSYQERAGIGNNRRRRRRRVGEGGPPMPREAPSRGYGWEESDRSHAPSLRNNGRSEELAVDSDPVAVNGQDHPEPAFPEDRRRSRREITKAPIEPPEVISVEMSSEEQDVFAWMGVSPLVLVDREIKNPKSAIISVSLPGELSNPDNNQAQSEDSSSSIVTIESEEEPVESVAEAEESEAEFDGKPNRRRRRRNSVVSTATEEETAGSEVPELSLVDTPVESDSVETADDGGPNRRRRRRSSATATD